MRLSVVWGVMGAVGAYGGPGIHGVRGGDMMVVVGGGEGQEFVSCPLLLQVGKGEEDGDAKGEAQDELEGRSRLATGMRGRGVELVHFCELG